MSKIAPKISVIIPIYNAAQYLARCLDSLVAQTMSDIEIICIDDKSTDNSLEILRGYSAKDPRIRVIALDKNSGVSVARNTGIAAAMGEYIGFVDSDDYVDLDFYEKLYIEALRTNADVVTGNIRETMFDGKYRDFTDWLMRIKEDKLFFNYSQWCAIFSKKFLTHNKINNPEGINSNEDTLFVIKCAVLANQIAVVSDTFYNYVRVPGSLSSEFLSDEKIYDKIKAANLIIDFLNSQNLSPEEYYKASYSMFQFIWRYLFYRTTKTATRMQLMEATLGLYSKYKHKEMLQKREGKIYPYLVCNDAEGLYTYVQSISRAKSSVIRIKLFNFIPLIRIKKYKKRHIKISLFGIPVLGIKLPNKKHGVKYNG